jgi:hypothetical protein
MNRSILVACVCAAALAACGRTIVREERVVEQPVVTPAPAVVEHHIVVPETVAVAPAACVLGGNSYSNGTLSCQSHSEYRCTNGVWEPTARGAC